MTTTYRSRRSRRCAFEGACLYGGRIRPGDLVVRRHRRYYHVDDFEAILRRIVEAAPKVAEALTAFGGALVEVSRRAAAIHVQVNEGRTPIGGNLARSIDPEVSRQVAANLLHRSRP